MNGMINVYKERGYTSHDVVARLRGILHIKKIGHTGTLDPDATGVLPVCVGQATKVCDLLMDQDKTYVAVVKLGIQTDTQDMTGTITATYPVDVTTDQIEDVVASFIGDIMQIPPMYSAIKVNGKKLYELARQGKEVERKERHVKIHNILCTDFYLEQDEFTITVTCSKGTYIRTLCQDIGKRLGCGATMKSLVRTRVGIFDIQDALTLDEIEKECHETADEIPPFFMPVDALFSEYPSCTVTKEAIKYLRNGNHIRPQYTTYKTPTDREIVKMYDEDGVFYALYQYSESDHMYRVKKMFQKG